MCMAVKRFSISFDTDLATVVQRSADESSEAVSAWLAEAARRRVRQDELLGAIDDFEHEEGAITHKELTAARRRLGLGAAAAQQRSA